jgi:hypothetical protein
VGRSKASMIGTGVGTNDFTPCKMTTCMPSPDSYSRPNTLRYSHSMLAHSALSTNLSNDPYNQSASLITFKLVPCYSSRPLESPSDESLPGCCCFDAARGTSDSRLFLPRSIGRPSNTLQSVTISAVYCSTFLAARLVRSM